MTITAYWKVICWNFPTDTDVNYEKTPVRTAGQDLIEVSPNYMPRMTPLFLAIVQELQHISPVPLAMRFEINVLVTPTFLVLHVLTTSPEICLLWCPPSFLYNG